MLMSNFLKERKSVREYKTKRVEKQVLNELLEYSLDLNEKNKGTFKFIFFDYGDDIYNTLKGKGGYSGVMIKSPHYMGLEVLKDDRESIIKAAYFMEDFITKAQSLGLGTCWISIVDVSRDIKEKIYEKLEGNFDYLLAIGYPAGKSIFKEEPTSSRLSVEDIVYFNEIGNSVDMDELKYRGLNDLFYYIRFAPSSYNSEPWRFILKEHKIILTLINSDDKLNLSDAGIAMYYLENMAKSIGIKGKWELLDGREVIIDNDRYTYIAEFHI